MNSYELSTYIEKYKGEYEPTGHWLARKEVLLIRNRADYPEERQVVCLPMVWSNTEYDGSTYFPELTERVQSLACGLDPHNSGLLPRCTDSTKHQQTRKKRTREPNNKYNIIKFQRQGTLEEVPSVTHKVDVRVEKCGNELPEALKLFTTKLKSWFINTQHPNVVEEVCACVAIEFGIHLDFNFTERNYSVLMNELKANNKKMKVKLHPIWVCSLYIGDLLICSAEDFNKEQAKHDCFADAMSRLVMPGLYIKDCASSENGHRRTSELCVGETFGSEVAIEKTHMLNTSQQSSVNSNTDEQNSTKITSGIGMEILKKMGWSGEGGLGKNEQGRAEPVLVEQRGNRRGIGFPVKTINKQRVKRLTKKERKKQSKLGGRGQTLMTMHACVSKKDKKGQKRRQQQSNVCVSKPAATLCSDVRSQCIKDQPLQLSQIKTYAKNTSSFGDFIIFETPSSINKPIKTLMNSGRQNKVAILFEISNIPVKYKDKIGYMGTLTIGGKVLTRVVNDDQKAVKRSVAEAALKELRTYCHTIRPVRSSEPDGAKNMAVNLAFIKSFDHNLSKSPSVFDKQTPKETGLYEEDGLGTSETMVQPVFDNHEHILDTDVGPLTEKAFIGMLKNVVAGEEDLVLSSQLTSDQRKALHKLCKKFNLKFTWLGKYAERYIVISRKRDVQELAQYIAKKGGSTSRYTLIPPH